MRLKWSRRWTAFVLIGLIAGLAAIVTAVPALDWRAKAVGLKLAGKIPEIATTDLAISSLSNSVRVDTNNLLNLHN